MRTPKYAVTRCSVVACSRPDITLPIEVKTAAKPTTEWRAATVWGRSVGVILLPIKNPNLNQRFCHPILYKRR